MSVQSPVQPVNVDPVAAAALSVTTVPCAKSCASLAHAVPQLIPAGLLVTVPDPSPPFETVSVRSSSNVAVTFRACDIVTSHVVPVGAGQLVHPVNDEPALAWAANVTTVPCGKSSMQTSPQVIPAGLLVTVPDPSPDFVTVSVRSSWNVAVALRACDIVT